uniref:Secreted protein n=1 Tax=Schistosoma curassoni TaxID=6186 RepID=A0A183JPL0_9TREM
MVQCGLFGWYINTVCLKIMIHIAEAEIAVLDLTGWARRKAGPIRTRDCSHVFYVPLVRSIIRCS